MHKKINVKTVFFLAILLAFLSFSTFLLNSEHETDPIRIFFESSAGNVLFTHSTHIQDFGVDCITCHHNLDNEPDTYSCSQCHLKEEQDGVLSKPDAIHQICIACHQDVGAGPISCNECHMQKK